MKRTADRIGWDRRLLEWDDGASNSHFARVYAVAGAIRHAEIEAARSARSSALARRKRVAAAVVDVEAGRTDLASLPPAFAAQVVRQQLRVAKRLARGLAEPDAAEAERYAEARRVAHVLVSRRIEFGFVGGHVVVGGRRRGEVVERGLRSDDSLNVRIFVQRVPKRPRVGLSKGQAERCDAKLLGLDEPYVEFNRKFWSMIRIDLDRTFASWGDLRCQVSSLGLPAMPHLVVADVDPSTGEVLRPHLLYHLPWQMGVWNAPEDPRCRKAPRRLFRAVHRALVHALLPLGADPGCLANPHHGKAPTSPYWHVVDDWETSTYPTLSQWTDARNAQGGRLLDLSVTVEEMVRLAATTLHDDPGASAETKTASNLLFTDLRQTAWKTLPAWRKADDARYARGLLDRSRLAEDLREVLLRRAREMSDNAERNDRVASLVSSYVARAWNADRVDMGKGIARGRDKHLIDLGDMSTRQAVAGRSTAMARSTANRTMVLEAIREAVERGESTTSAAIATRLGIDPRTVSKHRRSMAVDTVEAGSSVVWKDVDVGRESGNVDLSGTAAEVTDGLLKAPRFLSIQRNVVGKEGVTLAQVETSRDVDSAPVTGSRSVQIDLPDPPWPPPQPTPSPSSASTSPGSPELRGARATASPPSAACSSDPARQAPLRRGCSRPGSRTSCCSSTPPSSSSSATSSEAGDVAERLVVGAS